MLIYRVTCTDQAKVIDYVQKGKRARKIYERKKKTMYSVRNIQFNKMQKNIQFFMNKKSGLVLMSLLDNMYESEIV